MEEKALLELKNIGKSFDKNVVHLDINLKLYQNETLGLLGGSGTGKSVLLREIVGLEYVDHGEVIYHDQPIQNLKEIDLFKIRTKISYSFQNGALFDSQNVFDNLAYPLFEHTDLSLEEISAKVAEILGLIGLEGSEKLMPSDLSGGMQKRIGMARAIILEPEIILYDEPTAGLDPSNTQNILSVMEKLKGTGVSSIFVTHDIPAALKICDRILILYEGKIAFSGSPREFIDSENPIVKEFFLNSIKEV
ncbi:MAG: ATP-binding cassette domain-containing protein [Bacteriovoracaceae bacterium]|jgi:phospholipid/cholesterol/gamma-HCH transport system ATP-binding protein|nr:ATP-binding cassette domain-containing protein [Bacteriovoracaceae bacterium]